MLQGNRRLFSAFSIEKRERIYESVLSGGRIIIVVPGDGRSWKCFFCFQVFSPPQSTPNCPKIFSNNVKLNTNQS